MDIAARQQNRGRSTFVASFIGASLLIAVFLLCGTVRAQVSIGIQIGAPPPPRVVAVVPPTPGPDFFWVEGYWYPVGRHYKWHGGYWTRPPYAGARWVAPRHDGERYFAGYWDGDRGRFEHDHRWDRDHDRDRDRWHGDDRDEHHDREDHHDRDDHR
jgi:hypothetical protein